MLPSQAGDSQLIRLPGQTRVSPEEYKEFLGLGHGDVFDLDPDRFCPPLLHMHDMTLHGMEQLPTARGGGETAPRVFHALGVQQCPLVLCVAGVWCWSKTSIRQT